jgi:DNA-binding MarR family transcriptional regulator
MTEPHLCPEDAVLRQFLGYRMRRAFAAVQGDLNATLAPFGLRRLTFAVLGMVADQPGLRQARLAEVLNIEGPHLVGLLDELQGRGLIRRDRDPTDLRAHVLAPTTLGRDLAARAMLAVADHDARMLAGIPKAMRAAMDRGLERIEVKTRGAK